MPRETLFVRIDDTPVPNGVEQYCDSIDCRETNEGCSFLGDAVLGDIKDAEGTPYYRILTPAGKLISDFETINKNAFQQIIGQWYYVLARLLQDSDYARPYTVTFPMEYIDWLCKNDNEYYNTIGKELLINDCTIEVSGNDIFEEIIINKISKTISEALKATNYEFVVFSSSSVVAQSPVISDVLIDYQNTHFITFSQLEKWGILCEERRLWFKENLTYEKFYSQSKALIKNLINSNFEKLAKKDSDFFKYALLYCNKTSDKTQKVSLANEYQILLLMNRLKPTDLGLRLAMTQNLLVECEKHRSDSFSELVRAYREDNEIKKYNGYEKRICKTLGVKYKIVPNNTFSTFNLPIKVDEVLQIFNNIFQQSNREKNIKYGFYEIMFNSLQQDGQEKAYGYKEKVYGYYEEFCLRELKKSVDSIWGKYDPEKQSESDQSSGGCYITTAMCQYLGKDDDCDELTILRGFRDNWLIDQPNGTELVQEYYKYAPLIVERINEAPNKDILYDQISNHIYACISAIQNHQYEKAKDMYISMMRHLAEIFLLGRVDEECDNLNHVKIIK